MGDSPSCWRKQQATAPSSDILLRALTPPRAVELRSGDEAPRARSKGAGMEVEQNREQKSRKLGLNSPLCLSTLPHLLVYLDTLIGTFQLSDCGESKTSDHFQEKEMRNFPPPHPHRYPLWSQILVLIAKRRERKELTRGADGEGTESLLEPAQMSD